MNIRIGRLLAGLAAIGLTATAAQAHRQWLLPSATTLSGDDVWVTGTLGDAAFALKEILADLATDASSRLRLDRPAPRVGAGLRLGGLANACVDLSDGLLADLGHICERSGVGAEVELPLLPASIALLELEPSARWPLQASGGDDYELCFTATPRHREQIVQAMDFAATRVTRVGRIVAGQGVRALDESGAEWHWTISGYQHFR